MLRKVVAASFVLVLSVGFVFADEIRAVITKVEGNKVTVSKIEGKKGEFKKGEEQTMPVAKDVKVMAGAKKGEPGEPLEGGLKNKMFTDIPEKGIFARLTTEDSKITEISVFRFKGKKKE
jgi:hypothetical protein